MLFRLLSLFTILFAYGASFPESFSTDLNVENNVLISVNDKAAEAVRIYKEDQVTTIGESAFDGCAFEYLMISNTVKTNNATFPESLKKLYFTGSKEELSFTYPENVTFYEYGLDEGFMNYWTTYIRPNTDGATICNVEKNDYNKMKSLYNDLIPVDKTKVDSTPDGTSTIVNSIKYLDSVFSGSQGSKNTSREIPQSVMITLILIVASFGMTAIVFFYILKDKKVIK